ncbi:DUF3558 domain-containing protein [Actinosynnema mirum]|nr:DUF3558 domain-containing protein [Actinosynnema mirum]
MRVATILPLVAALAACAPTAEQGRAVAVQSAGVPSGETVPSGSESGRPAELGLRSRADNPCALVSASQLAEFGSFKPSSTKVDESGLGRSVSCSWQPASIVAGAHYSVVVYDFQFPYEVAERNLGSEWDNVEKTAVDGYPAITGFNSYGIVGCSTAVSVADGQIFMSGLLTSVESSPEYANPCDYSRRFASVIIKNLKG